MRLPAVTGRRVKRRTVVAAGLTMPFVARGSGTARVVIVGGGFGGAAAARALRSLMPGAEVTLVEANETFTACPFSNLVVVGARSIESQQFGYGRLVASGVRVIHAEATHVDPVARRVSLSNGSALAYDRLILSPGIDIVWGTPEGYDEATSTRMPHAWKAGTQTSLLRRQLDAMPDGGTVAMSVPAAPYRCPPAPYERASLIAWYLKSTKPRSTILVLDSKDSFSQQKLFQSSWARLYPDHLKWVPLSDDGAVVRVDPATLTLHTDFDAHTADVVNVIPPQKAGRIAAVAGVTDRSGWCPVDPSTFESRLVPGIHVIGDAATTGALPKSASAANAEAKVCAHALARLLDGGTPAVEPQLVSSCYALLARDRAIAVAGIYRPVDGVVTEIPGSGSTSALDAADDVRLQEAKNADAWFDTITHDTFG